MDTQKPHTHRGIHRRPTIDADRSLGIAAIKKAYNLSHADILGAQTTLFHLATASHTIRQSIHFILYHSMHRTITIMYARAPQCRNREILFVLIRETRSMCYLQKNNRKALRAYGEVPSAGTSILDLVP